MRKVQKEQAEEIIRLLSRVHDGIKRGIETGSNDEVLGLLAQCQESAIDLGQMIDEAEGEGTIAVSCLEEYCEQVYQIYSEISQGNKVNSHKAGKILRKTLIQAENSIKNDIKVRTEAVFLPYKASMWDSLESIWKAADEDPNCDAYVIPIPYYDKNPDGTFAKLHYEGDQYPEYVPVIWYEAYDFEKRKPDIIFIHNPYDKLNFVTSVPPFFYSRNLKRFTEKLVYIPYYILNEISPNNKNAIDNMRHFCTVPAVINADKVIVQSENMRQIYIDVMTEVVKDATLGRKYWEEKILGIGSPKIDKILDIETEDICLPESWRKMIQKPDGNRKKIILYNTSIAALLKHGETMLEKIKNVFQFFSKHKNEITLLWRPHPLIQATIESMRPMLWKKYEELILFYQEQGIGIYDDSPDMDRALALSDAYYGDQSSLVELYKKLGKPILLQNVEIKKDFLGG